jgi:hypothetical protein
MLKERISASINNFLSFEGVKARALVSRDGIITVAKKIGEVI